MSERITTTVLRKATDILRTNWTQGSYRDDDDFCIIGSVIEARIKLGLLERYANYEIAHINLGKRAQRN